MKHRVLTTALAATLAAGTLGVVGASGALAQSAPSPSAPSSASADGERRDGAAKRVAARGLHSEVVRRGKDGGFVTIVTQRGAVTAVTPTSVTLESADGYTRTYVLDGSTKIRVGRNDGRLADVRTGLQAGVRAVRTSEGDVAKQLVVRVK